MRRSLLLTAATITFALLSDEPRAEACGGCVVPPDTSTQVTGHRMILAASKTSTTLYDQIEYSGAPESFAWFLPIQGIVDVGLSADAMFQILADSSQVVVYPPPLNCVTSGSNRGFTAVSDEAAGDDKSVYVPADEGVNVLAQETVGPFETVQLESKTPGALVNWLTDHGYSIPADVKPVIDAYESEGFDFLAMKLVPGQGVSSMRPVRVTSQGAGLALPLRMVAAGTGAITPVLLHVVSEGRYEVQGRPNLLVTPSQVTWDWDQGLSNYRTLREDVLGKDGGAAWLTESSDRFYKDTVIQNAQYTIDSNPGKTGWGDPSTGLTEIDDAQADIDTLFAGMDPNSVWLTRMYARLSRDALAEDLQLSASATQVQVSRYIQTTVGKGTAPACPGTDPFACAMRPSREDGTALFVTVGGLVAALSMARRRRRSP